MKKLLLFLLLFPALCFAGSSNHVNIAFISSAGASCDSCTGGRTFSWHIEGVSAAAALTVTNGTPPDCGCSVGDTVAALGGGGTIVASPGGTGWGGYALYVSGAYDNAEVDISSRDVFDVDESTMVFEFYYTTWVDGARLFLSEGQVNEDYIMIDMPSAGELRLRYEGANAGSVYATTSGASLSASTVYVITVKWRQTGSPNTSINVNSVTGTNDTELTAMDTLPTTMNFGNHNGPLNAVYYLKLIEVHDSWL